MHEEILSLVEKQALQRIPTITDDFNSNLFMISKKDGGQRLFMNLTMLNNHVKSLLQQGEWMAKIDQKNPFFMVPITSQFQQFLLIKVKAETFSS